MQATIARAATKLATHAQPDPVSADVLHAESLVDVVDLRGYQLIGDREQVDIIRFNQRVNLAEGQKVTATVQAQHREHRLRPKNPPA